MRSNLSGLSSRAKIHAAHWLDEDVELRGFGAGGQVDFRLPLRRSSTPMRWPSTKTKPKSLIAAASSAVAGPAGMVVRYRMHRTSDRIFPWPAVCSSVTGAGRLLKIGATADSVTGANVMTGFFAGGSGMVSPGMRYLANSSRVLKNLSVVQPASLMGAS